MILDTPIDQSNLQLEKFAHFSDGLQSAGIGCTSFPCLRNVSLFQNVILLS